MKNDLNWEFASQEYSAENDDAVYTIDSDGDYPRLMIEFKKDILGIAESTTFAAAQLISDWLQENLHMLTIKDDGGDCEECKGEKCTCEEEE
jgi:hypothetical protein